MKDPRYPIGQFEPPAAYTAERRIEYVAQIDAAPAALRNAVRGLSAAQLATPYREGGWSVAQVVHHVPDSHMNSYIRFKCAVTEDNPSIKGYEEGRWATLADAGVMDLAASLLLLEALHLRWVMFLRSLTEEQFERTYHHPEQGNVSLDRALALYAWHGRHHVAQITDLRERSGW